MLDNLNIILGYFNGLHFIHQFNNSYLQNIPDVLKVVFFLEIALSLIQENVDLHYQLF